MFKISVNGASHQVEVDPDKPLLWVLREDLGLTGSKYGCGVGACGACTVIMNGEATRSCSVSIEDAAETEIVTIEGLPASEKLPDGELHPLQKEWINVQAPQCGYCQSGMIMASAALLKQNPSPSDNDINEALTNICRCGTYPRVRQAIKNVSKSA